MASKFNVKQDEVVVDQRILEGVLVAPFVWIPIHAWRDIMNTLPTELRLEAERSCDVQGGCIVTPRIIWVLVKALTEARRH